MQDIKRNISFLKAVKLLREKEMEEKMALIYVVEDDKNISEIESFALKNAGHQIVECSCAKQFHKQVQVRIPDLVLLDIMLPDEDGISILKKLRMQPATKDIPVIMATAKGSEYDKVIGLDSGADDYLAKPFGMMEMISRIKAVLRRTNSAEAPKYIKIGKLELNLETYAVVENGKRVQLTLKEYMLLRTFMENPERVFTRDQLLESIWGTDYAGETRTVDVHIGTLRTKLEACGDYIETVRGVGYRMGGQT